MPDAALLLHRCSATAMTPPQGLPAVAKWLHLLHTLLRQSTSSGVCATHAVMRCQKLASRQQVRSLPRQVMTI